jgi:excisionase family DNA binding protein
LRAEKYFTTGFNLMAEMLTAKDIQDMLQVDRSTIYRMAENGRIPAVKVGKQWRFSSDAIDTWLKAQSASPVSSPEIQPAVEITSGDDLASLLPIECVQLIQDTFADTLGVMVVITDMEGNPITDVSHTCGLFDAISDVPDAVHKCIESWHSLANTIDLEPKYMVSHLELLCARGLIRVGSELKGMVVVGGIAPPNWPPTQEQVQAMADEFGVNSEVLNARLSEVFYLDEAEQIRVLSFVQRIANIVAHIATERNALIGNLQSIVQLAA